MANLDLEEQEQLAEAKAFWQRYGNLILTLIMVAALAFSGWQGWQYWQARQALEASATFDALAKAVSDDDAKGVRDASGALLEKFSGTAYAPLGALTSARYFFERGDLKGARAQLQWVVDKTGSDELRDVARLRMVAVLMDEKGYDEALKTLEAKHTEAFAAQFAVARGDALVAKSQAAEARAAYKLALEKSKGQGFRESVQMRLDALGS
jgi:predicted negative regulator of RcsB-dependent stress response